jgi:hypothetical protein
MPGPYLFRPKPEMMGQSLTGLFYVLLLSIAFSLISCSSKPSSSKSAVSGNTPAASPLAQDSPVQPEPPRKIFESGEAVPAGYLGYKVLGSWFSDHVAQKDETQSGTGNYLFVELAVVNTDKKERTVVPMKLVDESGKEYALSEKSASLERSVTQIGKVDPNQSRRAIALFEVPRGHQYKLKIQGFNAADEVQIKLAPAAAPPSR